jgi:hypothetical protein
MSEFILTTQQGPVWYARLYLCTGYGWGDYVFLRYGHGPTRAAAIEALGGHTDF